MITGNQRVVPCMFILQQCKTEVLQSKHVKNECTFSAKRSVPILNCNTSSPVTVLPDHERMLYK